jgi:hypothetical protein
MPEKQDLELLRIFYIQITHQKRQSIPKQTIYKHNALFNQVNTGNKGMNQQNRIASVTTVLRDFPERKA